MNKLGKMALFAQIIYLVCSIGNFTQAQDATTAPLTVNGMAIVDLDGPYQYNSGGVPLFGYIRTPVFIMSIDPKDNNPAGKTAHQPTDRVKLRICKTNTEITVNYSDLVPSERKCQTRGRTWPEDIGSLPEWKINSGKLVVDQKATWSQIVKQALTGLSLKDIPISALPVGYQSVFLSEEQGKTVAITLPADDGSLFLGILPKLKTGNGS